MEYKLRTNRYRTQQSFDKDKIFIKRGGKMLNLYQMIQEGREDTEIEPTLKKYGCLEGHIAVDNNKILADFTEIEDFRGVNDKAIKAKEMFYDLPLDIRQKFNNNLNTFTKEGKAWVEKRIKEELKAKEQPIEQPKQENLELEVNNG